MLSEIEILNAAGEIDRRILGRIVFSDADKRVVLNSLTHPAVEAEILRRIGELEQIVAQRHHHRGCGLDD